jgi:mRNA interferase MazF
VIKQGDIFWLDLGKPSGSEPGFRRPAVVVQGNRFNDSAIKTIVICVITSNLTRADAPGNVMLQRREGGLKKQSVVNVSQLYTVNKSQLTEKIGKLSPARVVEIVAGIKLVLAPSL